MIWGKEAEGGRSMGLIGNRCSAEGLGMKLRNSLWGKRERIPNFFGVGVYLCMEARGQPQGFRGLLPLFSLFLALSLNRDLIV